MSSLGRAWQGQCPTPGKQRKVKKFQCIYKDFLSDGGEYSGLDLHGNIVMCILGLLTCSSMSEKSSLSTSP